MKLPSSYWLLIFLPLLLVSTPLMGEELSLEAANALVKIDGPLTAEQIEAIIPYLKANAQAYEDDQPLPYQDLAIWMSTDAKADAASANAIADQLKKLSRTEGMYVANELIKPFVRNHHAPSADIAQTLADGLEILVRRCRYQKVPTVSKAGEARLQMPPADKASRVKSTLVMKEIAKVQRLRDQKLKKELPVIKNNEQLWELERKLYVMKILAASGKDAEKLAKDIVTLDQDQNGLFGFVMLTFGDLAKSDRLSKESMEIYYDYLRKAYTGIDRGDNTNYTGYLIDFNPAGQSTYNGGKDNFQRGYAYKRGINALAEKIGKPKLTLKKKE